jgi:hypothetical protein
MHAIDHIACLLKLQLNKKCSGDIDTMVVDATKVIAALCNP